MSLRTNEGKQSQTVFSITTDEAKLRQLFDDIDFEHCGGISWAYFIQVTFITLSSWELVLLARKDFDESMQN